MTLADRLRALIEAVPEGGSVVLPRDWLAGQLAAENGIRESIVRDEQPSGGHGSTPGLLRARQVADRLGCSTRYVYARAGEFPFTVRLGRAVRFDSEGLARWLARQRAA